MGICAKASETSRQVEIPASVDGIRCAVTVTVCFQACSSGMAAAALRLLAIWLGPQLGAGKRDKREAPWRRAMARPEAAFYRMSAEDRLHRA